MSRGITDMGEAETLEKSWLVVWREITDSGVVVYEYGDKNEFYYLTPDQKGNNAPLIRTKTPY